MTKKNIIVTGGVGFLGTHLINKLVDNGYKNIVVIDKFAPTPKTRHDNVEYITADFGNEAVMKPILKNCDSLFHLASMVGVDNCRNHPDLVKKVNLFDAKKLIDWSTELGVKRIIYTSSSEAYGDSKELPYKEDNKLEPVSEYGKIKVLIEEYLKHAQKTNKTTIGIVRPFNVYGLGQVKNFVIPIFLDAAMHNEPIKIFGTGDQTRSFTYIEDVTEGILRLYQYDKTPYEIINIGNNQEYSVKGLAEIILSLLPKSRSHIEYLNYGENGVRDAKLEIARRVPSIEKAKQMLHFEAKITLLEGLTKIIKSGNF